MAQPANLSDALQKEIVNTLVPHFNNQQLNAILRAIDAYAGSSVDGAQATSITNLNAWATALATKLNADAGVTDTNYDTNPQA